MFPILSFRNLEKFQSGPYMLEWGMSISVYFTRHHWMTGNRSWFVDFQMKIQNMRTSKSASNSQSLLRLRLGQMRKAIQMLDLRKLWSLYRMTDDPSTSIRIYLLIPPNWPIPLRERQQCLKLRIRIDLTVCHCESRSDQATAPAASGGMSPVSPLLIPFHSLTKIDSVHFEP